MSDYPEIYVHSKKVPSEICNKIIETYEYGIKTNPSGYYQSGKIFEPLQRKDKATFLDEFEMQDIFADDNFDLNHEYSGSLSDIVNNYLQEALESYMDKFEVLKTIKIRSVRQKLQKTNKGGGYHIWHCEQCNVLVAERVLTWIIYLNDIEEGGETEFLHQSLRIPAKEGSILFFPASFAYTHRGNPPLSNVKYIATGWYNLY